MSSTPVTPMISYAERLKAQADQWKAALHQFGCDLRVAIPGIVQSFDPVGQTVSVKPAIKDRVRIDGVVTAVDPPLLDDVPVVIPRGGPYALTLPIAAGDECLLIFADLCYDGWFQSGETEDQFWPRHHDIADGFAVMGCWSQPRVLADYSTTSAQLRTEDGTVLVDVAAGVITIKAPSIIAAHVSANAQALLNASFYEWFTTVYMPSVRYNTVAPALPSAPLTTVLEGE